MSCCRKANPCYRRSFNAVADEEDSIVSGFVHTHTQQEKGQQTTRGGPEKNAAPEELFWQNFPAPLSSGDVALKLLLLH